MFNEGAKTLMEKHERDRMKTHKINDELRSAESNLSDGSEHIHFLFLFQLLDDVSGAAVDTGLLTSVPEVRYANTMKCTIQKKLHVKYQQEMAHT